MTGEMVDVKGWDGRPVTLETAIVDFTFKGKHFSACVAVAHRIVFVGVCYFQFPWKLPLRNTSC